MLQILSHLEDILYSSEAFWWSLALLSMKYLAFDSSSPYNNLHVGLPVPFHLEVNANALLRKKHNLPDCSNCTKDNISSNKGPNDNVRQLIAAKLNHVLNGSPTIY